MVVGKERLVAGQSRSAWEPVEISDDLARVIVVPAMGAGIARYDFLADRRTIPLMRPAPDEGTSDPFALACNLLVPWSNRISGGGFSFGGRFFSLAPNLLGEPYPIHGNGFQEHWTTVRQERHLLELSLHSNRPGPFRYDAHVTYALDGGALTISLDVTNRAGQRLPYGFGFHPWFPRAAGTRLTAPAEIVWLEDERHLPTKSVLISERPDWDFSSAAPLPMDWINNGFGGWPGAAVIEWPECGVSLTVETASLSTYIVYSPGKDAGFFCFEPVSHPVDAHNLAVEAATLGLLPLGDGESAATRCRFVPAVTADEPV